MQPMRNIAPDRKRDHQTIFLPSAAETSPQSNPKRTKIEQACSNCRVLRRKCNGQSPCSSCVEKSVRCDYAGDTQPPEKMTLARALKRISELEDRLRDYENLDLEKDGATTSSPRHIGQIYDYLPESHRPDDDMSQLLRGVNYLTISTRNPEFYGGSSSNAIITAVETPKLISQTPDSSMRPDLPAQQWIHSSPNLRLANASGSSLPPRPVADEYVNRYFQTAHRIYPILNQKTFMERYRNFWEGLPTEGRGYEIWIAVMYMVLAHGHQCSMVDPDSAVRQAALNSNHGEVCFNLAKAVLTDVSFTSGDMSSVNSLFLGFAWLYNQQRLHEAYAMMGAATRVGYAIGMHRELIVLGGTAADTNGWCASWWCLFTYETELAALSGRPCGIQPREVDVKPFSLESSPIDFQYLERMRQFSYLAWDAYEQVYSLEYKHTSVSERTMALKMADAALCTWYDEWSTNSVWAKEPHGLILRLRMTLHGCVNLADPLFPGTGYLNMRILLYRAFLNLVVQKKEAGKIIPGDLLAAAARCIVMAISLIETTTTCINPGSSGTLQAALLPSAGYLWNATITLLLYVTSQAVRDTLPETAPDYATVISTIQTAIAFLTVHQDALASASESIKKGQNLLNKAMASFDSAQKDGDAPDYQDGIRLPNFESPSDQILDFVHGFDVPTFDFGRPSSDHISGAIAGEKYAAGDQGQDPDFNAQWTQEVDTFFFQHLEEPG